MTDPREDWDDDRLDRGYRARFDVVPPPELGARLAAALPDDRRGSILTNWMGLRPGSGRFVAASSLTIVLALIVANAIWLGPVGRQGPGPSVALPSGVAAADLAGGPFPIQVTTPRAPRALPVLSVTAAIGVKDRTVGPFEIAVGGWFIRYNLRCPAVFDEVGVFESPCLNATWLLAGPQSLLGIHPLTDWRSPEADMPTPVVFVGHFHDPSAANCPAGDQRAICEARFVVDGVAWQSSSNLTDFPVQLAGHDVISVSAAILIRDSGVGTEVAVAGWYQGTGTIACPAILGAVVAPLEGPSCSLDAQWLMASPEELMQMSSTCQSGQASAVVCFEEHAPTGPAFHPVFESGVSLGRGSPLPMRGVIPPATVVFIGHFNDPRSSACLSPAVCAQRFVVDAIGWAGGTFYALPAPS